MGPVECGRLVRVDSNTVTNTARASGNGPYNRRELCVRQYYCRNTPLTDASNFYFFDHQLRIIYFENK
jgi:hypothetical protein